MNHKKKSLRLQNTLTGLNEELANSIGELIRDYGKVNDNDPNVYEIDFPEQDVFHIDNDLIGGKLILDVSYYEGTITIQKLNKDREVIGCLDIEYIEDIRYRLFIYRALANHYEPKK